MKNVCIVGYGSIGPVHADAVDKLSDVCLYAVCDVNPQAVVRCQSKYRHVVGYSDFEQMLKDKNIDAVHICTPHYLHYEMIKRALEEGKEVICEKPITMTAEEFDKLLCIDGCDKVCTVIQNRYNHCIKQLKALIERGELGDIIGVKGYVTWHKDPEYYLNDNWRGRKATEGGSALINQAIHTLDLMIYLVGNVKNVRASMHNYTLENVIDTEDTVEAYLEFADNIKGLFFATNTYVVNSSPEIEIVGTKATARYLYDKLFVNHEFIAENVTPTNEKSYWGCGHAALLDDYYSNNHHFSPSDIKNTMRTMFGIYDSAYHGNARIEVKE